MIRPDVYTRVLAHRLIMDVVVHGCTLDRAFEKPALQKLSVSDRQFVRLLVMTVLRHYRQAQNALTSFLKKPLSFKQTDIQVALTIGVVSLHYLKTPSHAAVDTTVELVKALNRFAFVSLVNAVLRACLRQWENVSSKLSEGIELPEWLFQSWCHFYGEEKAKKMCLALGQEPPLDITAPKHPSYWAEMLEGRLFFPHTIRLDNGGNITQKVGYNDGQWWVQNAAASVPVMLFSTLNGKKTADLCAAPGGKTAQLVAAGAIVDAFDISENRLKRLRENMKRLRFDHRVQTICTDLLKWNESFEYDAVLLDAPCSATGTLARHPDLIFHRSQVDIDRLVLLQKELLKKATTLIRTGGELVYSVCSLQPEEGEKQIYSFLKKFPNFCIVPPSAPFLKPFVTKEGFVRLTPIDGTDGFFAVLLRKNA